MTEQSKRARKNMLVWLVAYLLLLIPALFVSNALDSWWGTILGLALVAFAYVVAGKVADRATRR